MNKILKCLDLCEESGLFYVESIRQLRQGVALGLRMSPLRIIEHDSLIWLSFSGGKSCHVHVDRIQGIRSDEGLAFAATLTRVAALARECDAVLGGGE